MTLEEAIYILDELMSEDLEYGNDKAAKAQALGIEALKVYQQLKAGGVLTPSYKLPGETEE